MKGLRIGDESSKEVFLISDGWKITLVDGVYYGKRGKDDFSINENSNQLTVLN